MSETLVAPAPATAPAPAPVSAPVSAPAPVSAAPAPVAPGAPPAPVFGGHGSVPTTHVDPSKFSIREDFASAVLTEKLAEIPAKLAAAEAAKAAEPAVATVTVADTAPAEAAPTTDGTPAVPAPDAVKPPAEAEAEEDFRLDSPVVIATPEVMSRLLTEKPDFGKLLEADKELKGALFKTAREAAEGKQYKEIFADVAAGKQAHAGNATWTEVRDAFDASTTREGTVKALAKIAELSYERDDKGALVVGKNGKPVVGEAFYSFTENIVAMDHEHQVRELKKALEANLYPSEAKRAEDERLLSALEIVVDSAKLPTASNANLPDDVKQRLADVERREEALRQKEHGTKVQGRETFDAEIKTTAQTRISDGIGRILKNIEKQGAHLSPYLKDRLPRDIGAKLIAKINSVQALRDKMADLQKLAPSEDARQRRIAAIDEAIQEHLPGIAREELREAGVHIVKTTGDRQKKEGAQAETSRETEPKGSTGPAGPGGVKMSASAAFEAEEAGWRASHPNQPFDKVARESILTKVLARMNGPA